MKQRSHLYSIATLAALCSLFFALSYADSSRATRIGNHAATLAVSCDRLAQATKGKPLRISCTLTNRGSTELYLLQESFVLEGPSHPKALYVYQPVDGERVENTIRFAKDPRWGALFHRVVDIASSSLSHLLRLDPAKTMRLVVTWPIPGDQGYPDRGDWTAQIVLPYLGREALTRLQADSDKGALCRSRLLGISKSPSRDSFRLGAVRRENVDREATDPCLQTLSKAFEHSFSERLTVSVR
jgi:hypothetical protein